MPDVLAHAASANRRTFAAWGPSAAVHVERQPDDDPLEAPRSEEPRDRLEIARRRLRRTTTPIPRVVRPSSSQTATPMRASPTSSAAMRIDRA